MTPEELTSLVARLNEIARWAEKEGKDIAAIEFGTLDDAAAALREQAGEIEKYRSGATIPATIPKELLLSRLYSMRFLPFDVADIVDEDVRAAIAEIVSLRAQLATQAARVKELEGLLIESEGMLSDPQGGKAANELARQITAYLRRGSSPTATAMTSPIWFRLS